MTPEEDPVSVLDSIILCERPTRTPTTHWDGFFRRLVVGHSSQIQPQKHPGRRQRQRTTCATSTGSTPNKMRSMYNQIRTVLLLLHLAEVSALRGANSHQHNMEDAASALLRNAYSIVCRVTAVDTMYDTGAEHPGEYETEVCIPFVDGKDTDMILPINLPTDIRAEHSYAIATGTFFVHISNAVVVEHQDLIVADDAVYTPLHHLIHERRRLSVLENPASGTKSVYIVRVSTPDVSPTKSLAEIKSRLLGDGIGMKSQYEACSFGKLQWISAGEIDVTLNLPGSAYSRPRLLVEAASEKVKEVLGITDMTTLADKVIFCQPPVSGGWMAAAPINSWRLAFNDEWCTSLTATMHEMGHSLGLIHSGEDSEVYGDETGYMGYGEKSETSPLKCFNGFKNYQLGWYSDRTVTVDPSQPHRFSLAAFVDYDDSTSVDKHPVLLKVGDYFIQYNRAKAFNSETEEAQDMVTITQDVSGGSRRVAELNENEGFNSFSLDVSGASSGSVMVHVCERRDGNGPNGVDEMVISIASGDSFCDKLLPGEAASPQQPSVPQRPAEQDLAPENPTCAVAGDTCTEHASCCREFICMGFAEKKCEECRRIRQTCSSNGECCSMLKCTQGECTDPFNPFYGITLPP